MSNPKIICITPVKNEAWILERFLKCASLWADHIIVADQNSDDDSIKIAQSFEKVILVKNTSSAFNEPDRQKLLIETARKLPQPRLFIALDADEFLTPNFSTSSEWQTLLDAPAGTVICFQWANIRPDMKQYWTPLSDFPWGFIDDGSQHEGKIIHSPRIPIPINGPMIKLRDIKVMHYQYTDWERMRSKHRWYMVWERLNRPEQSAVKIYRQYHHMYSVHEKELQAIPHWWFNEYSKKGIDMTSIYKDRPFWWDKEVIELFKQHGIKRFARDYIWDIDWQKIAVTYGYASEETMCFRDPRNFFQKMFHSWLQRTQFLSRSLIVKSVDKFLSIFL